MHRLLFVLLVSTAALCQATSFQVAPPPGPNAVGLRVVHQYDYSRNYRGSIDIVSGKPYTGETARPVQTIIWYPAVRGSGKAMSFYDYTRIAGTEELFERPEADIAAAAAGLVRRNARGRDADTIKRVLANPMLALRDAKPAEGKHPVVIYAPSFNAWGWENADLCEYLASHGYVVIGSASMGAHSRAMSADLEGLEAQAGDIAFLLGYAHTLPFADTGRVAAAGFSWGGFANVVAASRDSRIKALVSLDGSLRSFPDLVAQVKGLSASRVAVPMLYLASKPKSQEDLSRRGKDFTKSLLNDMRFSDVYIATMNPMEHGHFSSFTERVAGDGAFEEYSRDEIISAYGWGARYVLNFLDGYLKGDPAGLAFLRNAPGKNGVPKHLMAMDARPAAATAPGVENLAIELQKRGFAHAHEVYQAMRKLDPAFELDGQWINRWGYDLMGAGRTGDAVEIFKLNTQLHPEDADMFDSLAEGYEQLKDKPAAIKAYERVLALEPENKKAANQIRALRATL
jgi:dienelactone hydrolase